MSQVRWSELLGQYKFIIYYTPRKKNGRMDALSRRPDYITIKKKSFALLVEGENGILTNIITQLNAIISTDDRRAIEWKNGRRIIDEQKIDDHIRRHHDPLEFGHPGVNGTITILRKSCYFKNMQARVWAYIKKCRNCQWNRHSTHTKYSPRKIISLLKGLWQEITMDFIIKLSKSRDLITGI